MGASINDCISMAQSDDEIAQRESKMAQAPASSS
jgi:hypothetical protein